MTFGQFKTVMVCTPKDCLHHFILKVEGCKKFKKEVDNWLLNFGFNHENVTFETAVYPSKTLRYMYLQEIDFKKTDLLLLDHCTKFTITEV